MDYIKEKPPKCICASTSNCGHISNVSAKKPNTIRKIFEQGRTPEFWLPFNDPGAAQLMYARNVAKAANMDMTEFFDVWGFFIPVSFKLYAYGSFSYTGDTGYD